MSTHTPSLDVDSLVAAIKREARARGDAEPFRVRSDDAQGRDTGLGVLPLPTRAESLREWMPFHGKVFLISAYRTLLLREPDTAGVAHYAQQIAEGRLSRWEVIGRLRLSGEGRARHVRVRGLWLGFAVATAYRVPLAGPLLALLARLLCVPAWLQDQRRDDRLIAQMLASGR
jgi:Domain of unknown function (DUF4214)